MVIAGVALAFDKDSLNDLAAVHGTFGLDFSHGGRGISTGPSLVWQRYVESGLERIRQA